MAVKFELEDVKVRMHDDIKRALDKPVDKRAWMMVIDIDKCIGCNACTVSCMAENVASPGVSYRVVKDVEIGEYPEVKRVFMPTNCQQCDNPICVEGLPEDAYTKRPDGILIFHYDKLKGKELFQKVSRQCPYTAVYHDTGAFYTEDTPQLEPYETRDSFEYGERWSRKGNEPSPVGAVRKCHFCLHRIEAGMLPACVTTCVGGAMHFGDKNDPKSVINEMLKERQSVRINESEGTEPRVLYLTGPMIDLQSCQSCHG